MRKVINYIFEARCHTSSGRSLNCRLLLVFKWGKIKMVWNAWTKTSCVYSSSCLILTTNFGCISLWPFATCGSYKDTFAALVLDVKSTFYAHLIFLCFSCNIDTSLMQDKGIRNFMVTNGISWIFPNLSYRLLYIFVYYDVLYQLFEISYYTCWSFH